MLDVIKTADEIVEKALAGEYCTTSFKVEGYWSETITLYVRSDCSEYNTGEFIKISTSSGGRDTKEVESDIEAYRNFAETLLQVTKVAEIVELNKEKILAAAEKRRKARMEQIRKEREELENLVKQDTPMTESDAKRMLEQIFEKGHATLLIRGTKKPVSAFIYETRMGTRKFSIKNSYGDTVRFTRKEAIQYLMKEISRSTVI